VQRRRLKDPDIRSTPREGGENVGKIKVSTQSKKRVLGRANVRSRGAGDPRGKKMAEGPPPQKKGGRREEQEQNEVASSTRGKGRSPGGRGDERNGRRRIEEGRKVS